jgi:hypothetical protein
VVRRDAKSKCGSSLDACPRRKSGSDSSSFPNGDTFAPKMLLDCLEGVSPETRHGVMAGGAMGFYGLN